MTSPPHVQRCVHRQPFGTGVHARTWQCTQPDPHPSGEGHAFPAEAEEFGRELQSQARPWLIGQLRTTLASLRHERRRTRDLSAVAVQLAGLAARGALVSSTTADWVRANAPDSASLLDLTRPWHHPRSTP